MKRSNNTNNNSGYFYSTHCILLTFHFTAQSHTASSISTEHNKLFKNKLFHSRRTVLDSQDAKKTPTATDECCARENACLPAATDECCPGGNACLPLCKKSMVCRGNASCSCLLSTCLYMWRDMVVVYSLERMLTQSDCELTINTQGS